MSKQTKIITVSGLKVGGRQPLLAIAGPCVIESQKACMDLAARLVDLAVKVDIPLIFKASYDKANRTSIDSYRGPGVDEGLDILAAIKQKFNVPVITDVHTPEEAEKAGKMIDVLQIPAFLCRQTDLVVACGETGRAVSVKKGQFLAPWDIDPIIGKIESTGNKKILMTERGSSFGYNNLVADMRSIPIMQERGYPVIFDATHSVQKPGGGGGFTSGDGALAPYLARAAVAAGCNGIFMETHVNPQRALSDKDNAIPLRQLEKLWRQLKAVRDAVGN